MIFAVLMKDSVEVKAQEKVESQLHLEYDRHGYIYAAIRQ